MTARRPRSCSSTVTILVETWSGAVAAMRCDTRGCPRWWRLMMLVSARYILRGILLGTGALHRLDKLFPERVVLEDTGELGDRMLGGALSFSLGAVQRRGGAAGLP